MRCLFLAFFLAAGLRAERPNIIVILVDDMGFSDIGCYGGEIPTPNLDKLAAGGARFSQFYNTGRCCPTRASLLTGQYSHRAGIGWMTANQKTPGYLGRLNADTLTAAEVMHEAGYFTSMSGKWHVGWNQGVTPKKRGFDRSLNLPAGGVHFDNQTGEKGGNKLYLDDVEISKDDPRLSPPWYGTDLWTDWAIKFIDEAREQKKPFFHYLAHTAPHFPCMAPEETIAKYRGKFMKGWDKLREERYARQTESGLIIKDWPLTPRPDAIPAWDSLSEKEKVRYDDMMAIYAAMIDEIDKSVGKLVAALDERELLENTLILFLSDNGGNAESGIKGRYEGDHPGDPHSNVFVGRCWAHLQNTPFRYYKHYNHEGGVATPLIAHWPAAIKAREGWINEPAHLIDLLPTFAQLSEKPFPTTIHGSEAAPLPGQSLVPLLTGEGEFAKRELFWEHEGNAAVRAGDDKIARVGRGGKWELYNLAKDRTEQHDLAKEHPERVEELVSHWKKWADENRVRPYPMGKER